MRKNPNCPLCKGESRFEVSARPLWWIKGTSEEQEIQKYFRCCRCTVLFEESRRVPPYHEDDWVDLDFYLENNSAEPLRFGTALLLGEAIRQRKARFLDVGCGAGLFLDMIRHLHSWSVMGVEPSPNMARYARKTFDVSVFKGYVQDMPSGMKFDIVGSQDVLEHVASPKCFLKGLAERLAPEGILFLTTPNSDDPEFKEKGSEYYALSPGMHLFLFNRASTIGLLRELGFRSLRIEEFMGRTGRMELAVLASRRKGALSGLPGLAEFVPDHGKNQTKAAESYAKGLVRRLPEGRGRLGALLRLCTYEIMGGKWKEARTTARHIEADGWAEISLQGRKPVNEIYKDVPSVLPDYLLLRAIVERHAGDPASAARWAHRAREMFRFLELIPRNRRYMPWQMSGQSEFELARALADSGQTNEARRLADCVLRYDLPKEVLTSVRAERRAWAGRAWAGRAWAKIKAAK